MKMIRNAKDMKELAKKLGVNDEWHEPDNSDVSVRLSGYSFDNAGGSSEHCVTFLKNDKPVALVNLATLCSIAAGYPGDNILSLGPESCTNCAKLNICKVFSSVHTIEFLSLLNKIRKNDAQEFSLSQILASGCQYYEK